jgi:hypothetical protein
MLPHLLSVPELVYPAMLAIGPRRALLYAGAASLCVTLFSYLLWQLPIHAWFREPMERSPKCPGCHSRDVRPSFCESAIDRFRKRLGLLPFRCRGCTQRFVSRCSVELHAKLFDQVDFGLYL